MEYWSITEGVFNCLIDKKRTDAFSNAIKNTIKPGDVVVDMGTGSGILAMVAASAGASKVYAVEIDKNNIVNLNKVFEKNNLSNIVKVIEGDATKISLPEKVDVIIGEMIATGLIEELHLPAMNNILKYAKKDVRVVLNKIENYIDLVNNNNKYYGYTFNVPRYEYADDKSLVSVSLSEKSIVNAVDFSVVNDNKVDQLLKIKCTRDGVLNGIRLSSKTTFYDKSVFSYYYNPRNQYIGTNCANGIKPQMFLADDTIITVNCRMISVKLSG